LQIVTQKDKTDTGLPTGVGLGCFDGLHIGHMALVGTLISECRMNGLVSVIYTFRRHPDNVLRKNRDNLLITSLEQKTRILEAQGIDRLVFQDFDEQFARLSPEEFVRNILVDSLNMKLAVVGFNYRFGHMGRGDPELLKRLGEKYGFRVIVIPPVKVDSEIVSSTLIRQYIAKGKMERVFQLLGRHFSLKGTVTDGRRVGHTLGFPTANIIAEPEMAVPAKGVYITKTFIRGRWMNSVTNVGNAPTVRGKDGRFSIETHILDYDDDLYGSEIEVSFYSRLRAEKRFESIDALKEQVRRDIESARRYWKVYG